MRIAAMISIELIEPVSSDICNKTKNECVEWDIMYFMILLTKLI